MLSRQRYLQRNFSKTGGKLLSFGYKRKSIHVVDPVSSELNVDYMSKSSNVMEDPSGSIEPKHTTDSTQIQTDPTQQSVHTGEYDGDLVGTGILPELEQEIDTLADPDFL